MRLYQTGVAIAGAGLIGRTLANLLSRNGIATILIDTARPLPASAEASPDPRTLAITPASANILASIHIWQRLPRERIGTFSQMHVWDETTGSEIRFDSAEICEPALGYIVEQQLLEQQLEQACTYLPDCTVIRHCQIASIVNREAEVELELTNGDRIQADLLVAADGSHSPVRKLAGLDGARHDYHQQAITCTVTSRLAHDHVARQRFLSNGPLAFLPLADPHRCGIVWSTTPEQARELLAMAEPEFCLTLQQAFEHRLGEITSCGKRSGFDLYRANAPAYIADRLVLVGDAAHTVHPLAGQGANMGLLDVAVLADLILKARAKQRTIYSRQLLRRYERWRRTDNQCMQLALDGIKTVFASRNNALVNLRRFGLDTVNSIPWIKSAIMHHAMGLEGDLPATAKRPLYPEMT